MSASFPRKRSTRYFVWTLLERHKSTLGEALASPGTTDAPTLAMALVATARGMAWVLGADVARLRPSPFGDVTRGRA